MLAKLLKDEIKSYRFSMGITFISALIITLLMKCMCMLPYHNDFRAFVQTTTFSLFYYVIMLVVFVAQILIIVRFYTTMVGDRGYLTWTLPAKTSTILWSKVIGGGIWYFLSVVFMMFCLILFIVGSYWDFDGMGMGEIFEAFREMFGDMVKSFEIKYLLPIMIYIFICFVMSLVGFMIFYLCIAIGQLFGKWRILASIGMYFAFMFISYIFSVVLMFIFMGGMFVFEDFMEHYSFLSLNVLLLVVLAGSVAIFAGMFAITHRIFDKHLNLE